jgi:hypothetical protein
MSVPQSLPPMSPGIAYAVRRLLEYAIETESEARRMCQRLWPKMDAGAVETVVIYWKAHNPSRSSETASGPPAKLAKIA